MVDNFQEFADEFATMAAAGHFHEPAMNTACALVPKSTDTGFTATSDLDSDGVVDSQELATCVSAALPKAKKTVMDQMEEIKAGKKQPKDLMAQYVPAAGDKNKRKQIQDAEFDMPTTCYDDWANPAGQPNNGCNTGGICEGDHANC